MQQRGEARRYEAGDEVRIIVEVEHTFDLHDVRALFAHEDFDPTRVGRGEESHTITLEAQRSDVREVSRRDATPQRVTTSRVLLRGRFTVEKATGEYRCRIMDAEYKGGRRISFDLGQDWEDFRFHVVQYPVTIPTVTSFSFPRPS